MSPWQLERKNDPRKPSNDLRRPRTRTHNDAAREEREKGSRPDAPLVEVRPIIIDDGE